MYYIKAKVTISIAGISGPFIQILSALVHGTSTNNAKDKFENYVKAQFAHMLPQNVAYEYIEIAGEIK